MKVFLNPREAGRWAPGAVVAIGKFDGVHRGHRRVIRAAARRARELATRSMVLTFDPLPQAYFCAEKFTPLMPLEERLRSISELGIDAAVVLPFDRCLARRSPDAFAARVLAGALRVMEVVVGADFCYGKDRAGNVDSLIAAGGELGFSVRAIPLLRDENGKINSSRIRDLLQNGRREEAEKHLGRPLTARKI